MENNSEPPAFKKTGLRYVLWLRRCFKNSHNKVLWRGEYCLLPDWKVNICMGYWQPGRKLFCCLILYETYDMFHIIYLIPWESHMLLWSISWTRFISSNDAGIKQGGGVLRPVQMLRLRSALICQDCTSSLSLCSLWNFRIKATAQKGKAYLYKIGFLNLSLLP